MDFALTKGAVSEGGCEVVQGEAKIQPSRRLTECSSEFELRIESRRLIDIIIKVIRRNLDEIWWQ